MMQRPLADDSSHEVRLPIESDAWTMIVDSSRSRTTSMGILDDLQRIDTGSNEHTAWAVYLGCNTSKRLAREWNVSQAAASCHLKRAVKNGSVTRIRNGIYWSNIGNRPTSRTTPFPWMINRLAE